MDKITISAQLMNAILAYIGSKPYQEVFQLVSAIQEEAKNQAKPEAQSTEEPHA